MFWIDLLGKQFFSLRFNRKNVLEQFQPQRQLDSKRCKRRRRPAARATLLEYKLARMMAERF